LKGLKIKIKINLQELKVKSDIFVGSRIFKLSNKNNILLD